MHRACRTSEQKNIHKIPLFFSSFKALVISVLLTPCLELSSTRLRATIFCL